MLTMGTKEPVLDECVRAGSHGSRGVYHLTPDSPSLMHGPGRKPPQQARPSKMSFECRNCCRNKDSEKESQDVRPEGQEQHDSQGYQPNQSGIDSIHPIGNQDGGR